MMAPHSFAFLKLQFYYWLIKLLSKLNIWSIIAVMFTPDDASGLRMSGGSYGGDSYQLLQAHLHWGCSNGVGSEHTINGKT